MNKTTKIATVVALVLCTSFLNINKLNAQNNLPQQSCNQQLGTGTIIYLNTGVNTTLSSSQNSGSNQNQNSGSKSGLIMDDNTGEVYEFKYAGLEVLEINGRYTYILQITASGKIIIRDVRHLPSLPSN